MDYEDEQARPVTPEEYVLRRLIVQYCDDTLDGHRWLWEKDRWNELVFSILAWDDWRAAEREIVPYAAEVFPEAFTVARLYDTARPGGFSPTPS